MRPLTLFQRVCRPNLPLFDPRRCILVALSALAVCAIGCSPGAAPPASKPSGAPSGEPVPATATPSAQPVLRGEIDGQSFVARSTVLWFDASAMWLSFDDDVPVTGGRFDPRANRAPANAFQIFLDPARLRAGRFAARDGEVPPDSPIRYAALQTVNRQTRQVHMADSGWSVLLVIDRVTERKAKSGEVALSLVGSVEVRFEKPPARLGGAFAAHDLLTDDEVDPSAPAIPAPLVAPSTAPAAPTPVVSPSGAPSTFPSRTD